MSFPSTQPLTYTKIAAEKGLELIGAPPSSVRDQATWRCTNCGTLHQKTLRAVRQAKNGCSCYKEDALNLSFYTTLAASLGVEWVGTLRPRNTKAPTLWRNPRSGVIVEASYYDLGYHHIVVELREKLGILVWVNLPTALRNVIKLMQVNEQPIGPDNEPMIVMPQLTREILERLAQLGIINGVPQTKGQYPMFTAIGRRLLTEASRLDGTYKPNERIASRAHRQAIAKERRRERPYSKRNKQRQQTTPT